MQLMRRQKQQQQRRKSESRKERNETLRECESNSSSKSKPLDLESSADSSLRSACASCIECPVTSAHPDEVATDVPDVPCKDGDSCVENVAGCGVPTRPSVQRPLEYVSLSGCFRLTDDGLRHLAQSSVSNVENGLPNLRHLDLSGCMNVSVEGLLPVLETCPLINFSHLFYCDNVFLGEGIDDLASGCRNLQRGSNRVCCRSGL